MLTAELTIICELEKVLEVSPRSTELYKKALEDLNPIVIRTSQDEEYRKNLASSFTIWKQLKTTMENCIIEHILKLDSDEYTYWYLRTVRGVLLLLRNISVSNQEIAQELLIQNTVIRLFLTLYECKTNYSEIETSLYITALSFLHNITKLSVLFDESMIDPLMKFLEYPIDHPEKKIELVYPFLLFFNNLLQNDDFLYFFYRHGSKDRILYEFIVKEVIDSHSHFFNHIAGKPEKIIAADNGNAKEEQISPTDFAIIRCFRKIVTNESFTPYLLNLEESEENKFINYLMIAQVVVTSSETWDKYQLTGIMLWCFDIFNKASQDVEEYFKTSTEDITIATSLHKKLSITLDIISCLTQYEHVQQYVLSYNGLEKLISLLDVLQNNLIRINFFKDKLGSIKDFKTSDAMGRKITDRAKINSRVDYQNYHIMATNFPECKLLIIEILGNLCHHNRDVQDKIRTLHGLKLVLSNCVIDDNDPFIKERSIVCIRFLLEDNEENKNFVASLEAKKAVDDETLSQAGYSVDIDKSGKIRLLSKEEEENRQ